MNSAAGKSATELSQGIPNTKWALQQLVMSEPLEVTSRHLDPTQIRTTARCAELRPQKASELMRVIPNPAKKPPEQQR